MATGEPRFTLKYSKLELILLALVVLGCALRIANVVRYNPIDALYSDPGRHWEHAKSNLDRDPLTAIDPMGYQIWLSTVARLTLGDRQAVVFYAALLSLLTPWFWYRFAREALQSRTIALVAWLALTWLPSWVGIFSYFMNETLSLPLTGFAFWMSWRALRKVTMNSCVIAAAGWCLACITRVGVLPAAVLCMGWVLHRHPRRIKSAFACAAVAFAMLFPLARRAHDLIGVWSPFGHPIMNQIFWATHSTTTRFSIIKPNELHVFQWGSPSTDEHPLAPLSDWSLGRSSQVVEIKINVQNGSRDWWNAWLEHRPSFPMLLRLWEENIVVLGLGNSWPEIWEQRGWDRWAMYLRWLWVPLLVLVSYASYRRVRKLRTWELLPAATLLLWACTAILPAAPMNGRFRKPLEGLTIVCALWFADRRWQKLAESLPQMKEASQS
jgi:hypothetical protein